MQKSNRRKIIEDDPIESTPPSKKRDQEIEKTNVAFKTTIENALLISKIQSVLELTVNTTSPDLCTVCLEANKPLLLSLCGHFKHGVCPQCMALMVASKMDWHIPRTGAPWNFTTALGVVVCPTCRQAPALCQSLQPCALSPDAMLPSTSSLPGTWLRTYSTAMSTRLMSWLEDSKPIMNLLLPPLPDLLNQYEVTPMAIQKFLEPAGPFCCPFSLDCPELHSEKWFATLESAQHHIAVCVCRPMKCAFCQNTFPTRLGAKHHIQEDCKSVQCNLCDRFGSWNQMESHLRHHNSLAFQQEYEILQVFSRREFVDDVSVLNHFLITDSDIQRAFTQSAVLNDIIAAQAVVHRAANFIRRI